MEDFHTLRKRAEKIQSQHEPERYRTFLRRVGAGVVDAGVLLVPYMLLLASFRFLEIPGRYLLVLAVYQLLSIGYNVFCVATFSTTVGKHIFGLTIAPVESEGDRVPLLLAFQREVLNQTSLLLYLGLIITFSSRGSLAASDGALSNAFDDPLLNIVDVLVFLIFISEAVTALLSRKRRAIHDHIAGTVVLKDVLKNKALPTLAVLASVALFILNNQFVYRYFKS